MVTAIGFIALLAASYLMMNYLGSPSRELDQLIAMEEQAEQLRKRCTYDSNMRDRNTRQRNQLLVRIARKRQALASEHKLQAREINRALRARRRAH
jgi:hypothetical protein